MGNRALLKQRKNKTKTEVQSVPSTRDAGGTGGSTENQHTEYRGGGTAGRVEIGGETRGGMLKGFRLRKPLPPEVHHSRHILREPERSTAEPAQRNK
jgi:hypothetical protein